MGDEYCLILALFLSNRHYFCVSFSTASLPSDTFSLLALPCNRHLNLPTGGRFPPKKKTARKSLRILAGSRFKPKRVCSTWLFIHYNTIYQFTLQNEAIGHDGRCTPRFS